MMRLETTTAPASPPRRETLQDLMSLLPSKTDDKGDIDVDMDKKPDLSASGSMDTTTIKKEVDPSEGMGVRPIYGFEGIPSFPPKWTYPPRPVVSSISS